MRVIHENVSELTQLGVYCAGVHRKHSVELKRLISRRTMVKNTITTLYARET